MVGESNIQGLGWRAVEVSDVEAIDWLRRSFGGHSVGLMRDEG